MNGGIIDASKIQNDCFPLVDANAFISHSHSDIREVTLNCYWIEIQMRIGKTIIPYFSSNAHLMLSSALSMMIDKYEALFSYDTPNSISARDVITKTIRNKTHSQ